MFRKSHVKEGHIESLRPLAGGRIFFDKLFDERHVVNTDRCLSRVGIVDLKAVDENQCFSLKLCHIRCIFSAPYMSMPKSRVCSMLAGATFRNCGTVDSGIGAEEVGIVGALVGRETFVVAGKLFESEAFSVVGRDVVVAAALAAASISGETSPKATAWLRSMSSQTD